MERCDRWFKTERHRQSDHGKNDVGTKAKRRSEKKKRYWNVLGNQSERERERESLQRKKNFMSLILMFVCFKFFPQLFYEKSEGDWRYKTPLSSRQEDSSYITSVREQ